MVTIPPKVENILVLNINYWAGGAHDIWGNRQCDQPEYETETENEQTHSFRQQAFNDQRIEVVGITSTFHLGRCQVKLSKPLRLCQGSHIQLHLLSGRHAYHVDGEPREVQVGQQKAVFDFSYCNQ